MKKPVLLLGILVLGSLASAQSVTLGFESYTGGILYCNYEQLQRVPAFGASVWQGVDNLTVGCGKPVNATIAGASGGGHFIDVSNGTGKKVKINGVVYADNIYDAYNQAFTETQWFVATNLVPDSDPKKFGWYGFSSVSEAFFADNFGHLTSQIPGPEAASNGTTAGKFQK